MKSLGHGANVEEMASLYGKNPKEIIDFSSNINPKVPEVLEEVLKEALQNAKAYPDIHYTVLRKSIATYLSVKAEEIIVGNGATEIVYLLMKTLNNKLQGGTLGVMNPTFSEYERSSRLSGMQIKDLYLTEAGNTFEINQAKLAESLDEIDALFICNPNNPTGHVQDLTGIIEILEAREKLLIVDETFMEFVAEEEKLSLVNKISQYKNLIIIKAVTKFFGLPGLRLGYGVTSNKTLLEGMYNYKEPWTVNSFAEALTPKFLEDKAYIKESKAYFIKERERMMNTLSEIKGLKVYEATTNFILIQLFEKTASELKTNLFKKHNMLIRDASNFKGLDEHFIRVAVKSEIENNQLIAAIREELNHELY
ncbi:threonine-phosphate decarboxylase CobD [Cellulosilyticum ruminicola]|uniref:threonine-phosphate decarboxylase CobD n=1 Tax=Cellulosilyticum ruminicola TaxID=425254 RepID=UPI0006D222CA|nr:threonine-phosphate decarboxylase CobD [Cellulosilyticum ruminicola]